MLPGCLLAAFLLAALRMDSCLAACCLLAGWQVAACRQAVGWQAGLAGLAGSLAGWLAAGGACLLAAWLAARLCSGYLQP